jgi:hypothetical protein
MRNRLKLIIKIRDLLFFTNCRSVKAKPKAIVLKIPKTISLGRLNGSIEFQGETKTETTMEVQIT